MKAPTYENNDSTKSNVKSHKTVNVDNFQFSIVNCQLSIVHYPLSTVHFSSSQEEKGNDDCGEAGEELCHDDGQEHFRVVAGGEA